MSSMTPPPADEPINATPISSAPPPFIPIQLDPTKDSGKDVEGTSAIPEKTSEAEKKAEEMAAKKSKARQRDSESKGKWWPCTTTNFELQNLEGEGFLQPGSWRATPSALAPAPQDNEMVLTKALVERGFSFPPSDFFLEILKAYGLQPHNISPNSVLAISNHVTLCEGHLRVTPELLFQYYFTVKKERIRQSSELATCGTITFMLRPGRVYPTPTAMNTGRDDPMRVTKDNLSADALDKRIRVLIKVPRELRVHVCNKDIHMNGSGTALEALEENELGTLLRVPSTGNTDPDAASGSQPPKAPRAPKKKAKPSPASFPITPEVEVPPKASSASKPDPKDIINVDDLPEDSAHHGDSAKGTSSPVPPSPQPSSAFAGPTEEE
ncbi:hypothetical protein QYE76_019152 [Lolium multiflorum]|uniref:Transposase (putative) gypsy type domain-containing protein n=1 Tax=Lolium multiflorum TaxID=4521 RepID=A0AAD8R2D3_LOLMU|nr:hypothetical protein QYE76_019152 [Lolium multiflorum]